MTLAITLKPDQFPDQFYIDLAVGVKSFEDICQIYGLDPADVEQIENDALFQQRFKLAQQAVDDDGRAFAARCRTVVTRSIPHMENLMRDPDTPASTQLETFKALVKYGKLEPEKAVDQTQTGPQITFNILNADGTPMFSVDSSPHAPKIPKQEPISIEQEANRHEDQAPLAHLQEVSGFFT